MYVHGPFRDGEGSRDPGSPLIPASVVSGLGFRV